MKGIEMKKNGRQVHYDVRIRWTYGNDTIMLNGTSSLIIGIDESIKGKYVHEEIIEQAENYVLESLPKWTKDHRARFLYFIRDLLNVETQEVKLV